MFVECIKTMNDGYVLSNRTDSYRHLAIVALFLNHLPPSPCISFLPQTSPFPHAWWCPLDPFPSLNLVLDLASSNFGITSGSWIILSLATEYNHIVTASWQCPSYPPSCPLLRLPPLHLPKHSIVLSTSVFPAICSSYSHPSLKGKFKHLLLHRGCLIHNLEVSFRSQRPHNYSSGPITSFAMQNLCVHLIPPADFNLVKGRE